MVVHYDFVSKIPESRDGQMNSRSIVGLRGMMENKPIHERLLDAFYADKPLRFDGMEMFVEEFTEERYQNPKLFRFYVEIKIEV